MVSLQKLSALMVDTSLNKKGDTDMKQTVKEYKVEYKMKYYEPVKTITVISTSKVLAEMKAQYTEIPKIEGDIPVCAWVKE